MTSGTQHQMNSAAASRKIRTKSLHQLPSECSLRCRWNKSQNLKCKDQEGQEKAKEILIHEQA
jgi:hypothetical protein